MPLILSWNIDEKIAPTAPIIDKLFPNMASSLHDICCIHRTIYHYNFCEGKYSKKLKIEKELFFFGISHVQEVFAFTNEAFEFIMFSSGMKIDAISTWAQLSQLKRGI